MCFIKLCKPLHYDKPVIHKGEAVIHEGTVTYRCSMSEAEQTDECKNWNL